MTQSRVTCKTCELTERRNSGSAPLWDCIHRGQHWDVAHAFNSSLEGWLVLVLQRHAEALHELSEAESMELGSLIRRVSMALREVTGCVKTYVIQFAEHPSHPHVHFHIVPRASDQPEDRRSTSVFSYLSDVEADWTAEEVMNQIAVRVQACLQA